MNSAAAVAVEAISFSSLAISHATQSKAASVVIGNGDATGGSKTWSDNPPSRFLPQAQWRSAGQRRRGRDPAQGWPTAGMLWRSTDGSSSWRSWTLQALQVGNDCRNLIGIGDEFRHIRMSGRNAFGKRLFKIGKRIPLR